MRHVWVIGSGGLLGKALSQILHDMGDTIFVPRQPLAWSDETHLIMQLKAAVTEFAGHIVPGDAWQIYWAAGIGTLSAPASFMVRETATLAAFLGMLEQQTVLCNTRGAFGFASSAGAIYGGTLDEVINEDTAVAPTTPYAYAKLEQEDLVTAFSTRQRGVRSLIARITTLYGAGQSLGKKQGLLSHIARSIVRNKAIQIYVPLDTIRDYITASDAAARIILNLQDDSPERYRTLLVASEHPTTIAEIISTFKRVSRRTPRVITSFSSESALYTRKIYYRSLSKTWTHHYPSTSLIVGVGQLLQAERFSFAQPVHK